MRCDELVIYRDMRNHDELLHKMTGLMIDDSSHDGKAIDRVFYECAHQLLSLADSHGFRGNLWHCFLTYLLVNHENSYSRACEIGGFATGTVNEAVLHDMYIFQEWFQCNITEKVARSCAGVVSMVLNYQPSGAGQGIYSRQLRDRINALAVSLAGAARPEEMKRQLTAFYQEYGVGTLGLHKAFRVVRDERGLAIVPIANMAETALNDLVGYELAKQKLVDNTEAFLNGKKANNCLLYGDGGTGKSSSIKGIANEYYSRGLRLIEVYKHQCRDLHDVTALIKNRNYKFIIYMDDLSFEDFEVEYKYLKAVIEGGLETKPANVLIYATSNRRHLIREKFSDKEDRRDDLHKSDTVQEKLSLAARFGVSIYYGAPDRKEFHNIVKSLAARQHIELDEAELTAAADRWEMVHGGLSGRTAQQFIDYLSGSV